MHPQKPKAHLRHTLNPSATKEAVFGALNCGQYYEAGKVMKPLSLKNLQSKSDLPSAEDAV